MRQTYEVRDFRFSRDGGFTGPPNRLVLHTDGNAGPHTALGALSWGETSAAFTIHYYIDGPIVYRAIPEEHWAWHVIEPRKAAELGYPTPRGRGDYQAIGIEHVMEPDGSWSQETRITSVLLGADILTRWPAIAVFEHADLDPWTRSSDVGDALNMDDWRADVADVLSGRTPYRTVGPTASGKPFTGERPPELESQEVTEDLNTAETQALINATISATLGGEAFIERLKAYQAGVQAGFDFLYAEVAKLRARASNDDQAEIDALEANVTALKARLDAAKVVI